jgi:tellurite resistance protein TehA-like permease
MLATWLLPVVPCVVIATTGGLVAKPLIEISASRAILTLLISSLSLLLGLTLTFMIVTVYLLRLMVYGLPPKGFIVSSFLPVGPFGQVKIFHFRTELAANFRGQGGTAFLLIADGLMELSSSGREDLHSMISSPIAGSVFKLIAVVFALTLWINGALWVLVAVTSIIDVLSRNQVPFGVPFWGMTFPIVGLHM